MRQDLNSEVGSKTMQVSQRLFMHLGQAGIKYVCGVIGREAAVLRPCCELDLILVRHEQSAAIMCDAYGRLTGKPQVCLSTLGPGVTNMMTGVASAYKDQSPMLAIAAQAETDRHHSRVHQYLDNVALMRPVTKYSAEPRSADAVHCAVEEALAAAVAERPGPCFVSIPIDVMEAQWPRLTGPAVSSACKAGDLDKRGLSYIYRCLEQAHQPLLLAGAASLRPGVSAQIQEFAERHGVPVATSLGGKGVIPETHPLCLGPLTKYLDLFVRPGLVAQVLESVDVLLLVGYDYAEDLTPELWTRGSDKKILRVDQIANDVSEMMRVDCDVYGASIEDSFRHLNSMPPLAKSMTLDVQAVREAKRLATCNGHHATPWPPAIVRAVRRLLGANDVVVTDVGIHKHLAGIFYDVYKCNTYLGSNGLATMGFGLPAAMGAKLARPASRVVAICGDGGFHSVSHELATCARYGINVTVVVLKDDHFGLIRHYERKGWGDNDERMTRLGRIDFCELARANGCIGLKAGSLAEFEKRMQCALTADQPVVVEVPVQYPEF